MKNLTLISLSFLLFFLVIGCSKHPFQDKDKETIMGFASETAEEIMNNNALNNEEKARRLTKLGEQLLESPRSAEFALEMFEKALSLFRTNSAANFYAAVLKPIHTLQGIPVRLNDLVGSSAIKKFINSTLRNVKNNDAYTFFNGLLRGKRPQETFKISSEAQEFLVMELLPALELSLNRLAIVEDDEHFITSFDYRHWQSGWHMKSTISFGDAEVHSLKSALIGLKTLLKMASAYNMDAAISLYRQFKDQRHTLKEGVSAIQSYPIVLTLNPGAAGRLTSILSDVSDAIEGVRTVAWILSSRQVKDNFPLSPMSEASYSEFIKDLNDLTELLSGPTEIDFGDFGQTDNGTKTMIHFTAWLSNPIPDLKTLLPVEFDKSGNKIITFPDLSFGGIVPNRDLVRALCTKESPPKWLQCP